MDLRGTLTPQKGKEYLARRVARGKVVICRLKELVMPSTRQPISWIKGVFQLKGILLLLHSNLKQVTECGLKSQDAPSKIKQARDTVCA